MPSGFPSFHYCGPGSVPGWGSEILQAMFMAKNKTKQNRQKQYGIAIKVGTEINGTKQSAQDFPGGTVDKNLPTNGGDMGSILGARRFHLSMSQSN